MIYLETEHLILRDYCEDDFGEYYKLKSDPKTMYYLQDIQMFTKEEAYEDFRAVLDDMQRTDRKFYFMHISFILSSGGKDTLQRPLSVRLNLHF